MRLVRRIRPARKVLLIGLSILLLWSATLIAEEYTIDLGRGEVPVYIPSGYEPGFPTPLVVLLHGYGSSGFEQDAYMRFKAIADEYNFIYTYPDGTPDILGARFWNATPACCDFFRTGVDDSAYIMSIINTIKSAASVDERRVFVVGHSNGSFMAHRLACDHADSIAAIAGLGGSSYPDFAQCAPSEPVHTLRIHGTLDETIAYDGSNLPLFRFPGAIDLSRQWLEFNQCDLIVDISPQRLDLDLLVPGDETVVAVADRNCLEGGSSELWTMQESGHVPFLTLTDFNRKVIEYFYTHTK